MSVGMAMHLPWRPTCCTGRHTGSHITRAPLQVACSGQHARHVCSAAPATVSGSTGLPVSRRDTLLLGAGALAAAQLPQLAQPRTASAAAALTQAAPKETVELGHSGLQVTPIGVGAWSWGDNSGYWGYNKDYSRDDNLQAYKTLMENGVTFIDTAEVYGFGQSEKFLGEFMRETGTSPTIATKFAPLPWRFSSDSVVKALRGSLERLQLDQVGLYMIHWPGFFVSAFSNDAYVEGLAKCHQLGLAKAVGVSNFNAGRVRKAASILQERGVPLASNQVQYSLLYRAPETNGVAAACRESGTTLVAYSPLAQGLLTGKYTQNNLPSGPRGRVITAERVKEVEPLIGLMRDIGRAHNGKTVSQVAINWTISKGALPIPGAKNARQVAETAGAFGWRLSDYEVAALDATSGKISKGTGAPFENW